MTMGLRHCIRFILMLSVPLLCRATKFLNSSSFLDTPSGSSLPQVSTLSTVRSLAESLATERREIVLSTFLVSPEGPRELLTDILRNFAQSLSSVGLLEHSLLVANDHITAEFALDQGIPCVVDNLMTTLYADSTTGASKAEGFNPVVNKWLWAQQLLQMDYTILFLDWDVTDSLTPCQSTGVWIIKAGVVTQRFLDEFVTELLANTPGWWEQAAFNEFLPSWTMGTGLQAPLRYRLLPYRQYMNIGIWHELGQESDASEELIVLHGGYVGLADKASALAETGHFHPESWDPELGKELIQKLLDITSSDNTNAL